MNYVIILSEQEKEVFYKALAQAQQNLDSIKCITIEQANDINKEKEDIHNLYETVFELIPERSSVVITDPTETIVSKDKNDLYVVWKHDKDDIEDSSFELHAANRGEITDEATDDVIDDDLYNSVKEDIDEDQYIDFDEEWGFDIQYKYIGKIVHRP